MKTSQYGGARFAWGLLLISCPAWAEVLAGSVRDMGAPSKGIDAVSLSVTGPGSKELARGLTNGQGEFHLTYALPRRKMKVKVTFERAGFIPVRLEQAIGDISPATPIYLLRAGEDDAYYRQTASVLQQLAKSGAHAGPGSAAATVAALPANDKATVLRHLDAMSAHQVVKAVKVAEYNALLTSRVTQAFSQDQTIDASEMTVETFKGVVQLSGFATQADKKAAVKLAKKVEGVTTVKSDVIVK